MGPRTGDRGPGAGPRGESWREEAVTFSSGERRLTGVLCLPMPDPRTPRPAVLVIHGWGSYRSGPHRMLVELCRCLARAGLPALRFDFSGRGDSSGDYWATDLDAMIADTGAAGDFLAGRTGAREMAAVGLCSGANVALGAAAAADRFRSVCALSALPFQRQRGRAQGAKRTGSALRELVLKALRAETYRRFFRGEVSVGRILRRLLLGEGGRSARAGGAGGNGSGRNLKDSRRDIQEELAGYGGRLLFVYGAADAEGLSGWRDVLGPFLREKRVSHSQIEVPGADHDYHGLTPKRSVADAVLQFLTAGS